MWQDVMSRDASLSSPVENDLELVAQLRMARAEMLRRLEQLRNREIAVMYMVRSKGQHVPDDPSAALPPSVVSGADQQQPPQQPQQQ